MIGHSLSHYRIISKLGEGGMGEVYLAEDIELERQVALKVLRAEIAGDEERVPRFVQEAKAASALNHPNILTVYEIGRAKDVRFIAAELIKGETLRDRLRVEPLSLGEALDVALQVAAALNAAHQAGIVHRDVKPENIMLRDDGLVKVLDFGLAKLTEKPEPVSSEDVTRVHVKTSPGLEMGTVAYMSPEQARGKQVDSRSDIWSLGVVIYEMLTKRTPFADETTSDTIAAILTREPAPLDSETPPELQRIVRKSLQRRADERYQTIRDFQLDLKSLKRELEFSEELERSQVSSVSASSTASAGQTSAAPAVSSTSAAPQTLEVSAARQTSSAEYLISEIKRHKQGMAGVLFAFLIAAIGIGYWFLSTRNASAKSIESIAVLPFVNEGGNPNLEYLSDGMAETLIGSLSQLPKLNIKARSSVFRYKGREFDLQRIAQELKVQAILTGRVAQRGDQLTLSLELVDTQTENVIWTEQYNRKQTDLVSLQGEIARDVSSKLKTKLSGADEAKLTKTYTTSPDAYQSYLRGRFFWNKRNEESIRKAIEQFKEAADKDPNYALAFVGLADSYVLLPYYSGGNSNDMAAQAKVYALRALEIDDSLGEAHSSLGYVYRLSWSWAAAEKELKRAIELNPKYATAHKFLGNVLTDLGRTQESLVEYKRAQELEPLSMIINANLAEVYLQQGDANAAVEQCKRAIDLDPNWYYAWQELSLAHIAQGRNAEALAEAEKGVELSKRFSVPLGVLGYVYARTGKRSEAAAVVEELKKRYTESRANGYDLAKAYVGLGETDQAFAWLEKDFQSHNATMPNFLDLAPLDVLRNDPRFSDLARRIGLRTLK